MKKQVIAIFLILALSLMSGCEKQDSKQIVSDLTEDTSAVASEYEVGTFQIDIVRSSINIHGHMFTVPQRLSELSDNLTYEFVNEEFDDGLYEVEISDNSGVILHSIAENAHKKSKKASLHNIALTDSESNILGITPLVSTKEEVLKQFGEPTEQKQSDLGNKTITVFIYGTQGASNGYQVDGQFMNIAFNKDNIIDSIVINYIE